MTLYNKKTDHQTRCLRFQEINWTGRCEAADDVAKVEIGGNFLDIDDLKKYYEVSANALFTTGKESCQGE